MEEKKGIENGKERKIYCEIITFCDGVIEALIDHADYDSLHHDGIGYDERNECKIFDNLKAALEFAQKKTNDITCSIEELKK